MRLPALALAALCAGPLPARADGVTIPHFAEETAAAGITAVYSGEWEYMVGGGVATFDCNDDGFPDMLIAGGAEPASFYRNESTQGGALTFTAAQSGLELDAVTGAWPLDIDGDGITDLALTRVGENVVMRGLGNCRFARANEAWGFDGGDGWSTAFAATWEAGAAWPTLAVGNYIDRTQDDFPWGSCTDNWLHRPAAPEAPLCGTAAAETQLLRPLDAVHRLGQVGHAIAARVERPRVLQGRAGTDVASAGRQSAVPADRGRRLEAAPDLGHGHREL